MRKLMSLIATTIVLGVAGSQPTAAQSLLSGAATASPTVSLRGLGESTILSTRPLDTGKAANEAGAGLASFEQPKSSLILAGEESVLNLTFVLDAEKAAAGGDLEIAYRNAVSVMPEASAVSIMVNGSPVGEFPIRSPSGFDKKVITLSPAILRAGVNDVRLRGVQRHRVDCSMEATYELWTEIDNQSSGFRPLDGTRIEDFASLRTVGRDHRGLTDLRLILRQGAGVDALNRAAPIVQTLALALNREDVSVTVAENAGRGPGIDLFVSTDDDPNSLKTVRSDAPYGISIIAGTDPVRPGVALRAATTGEIPGLLLNSIQGLLKPALDTGIRAIKKGEIRADASSVYTLSDAGYNSVPFSGRLFHMGFDMVLPADFYPADYATMDLALHAATSPGLKPTSQLLVRVNDQIVKSLPMRNTDGEVFSGRRLELPLRAFRPGRNQIELLAELERSADDRCIFAERDDSVPRFILLETTEIRVPALARVARSPELAALAGSAYPYAGSTGVDVHALKPDVSSISAALTMIAKMSIAAREPVMTQLVFGPPHANTDRNAVVIGSHGAAADLVRLGAGNFPATPQEIDFAQAPHFLDPISTSAVNMTGSAIPVAVTTDPAMLLNAFRQSTRNMGESGSTAHDFNLGLSNAYRSFLRWLNYENPSQTASLTEPHRKAVLSQRPSVSGNGVVTWLTADTSLEMSEATDMLADPSVWNRLEGETVVLDLDHHSIKTSRPTSYFTYDVVDYGPGNLRRIAAAWLADNFRIYVALVIGLMVVFAIWLGRAVPGSGVRTDQ